MEKYKGILNELLRTTMVIRKNMMANEAGQMIREEWAATHDGVYPADAQVEALLSDIYPWVFGPRSIMRALILATDKYDRGDTPAGSEVYNILVIAHRMDKSGVILKAYETFTNEQRRLPEPDPYMCAVRF